MRKELGPSGEPNGSQRRMSGSFSETGANRFKDTISRVFRRFTDGTSPKKGYPAIDVSQKKTKAQDGKERSASGERKQELDIHAQISGTPEQARIGGIPPEPPEKGRDGIEAEDEGKSLRPYERAMRFIQPFDGTQEEVSEAERAIVGQEFNTLVDNLLLWKIKDTYAAGPGKKNTDKLELRILGDDLVGREIDQCTAQIFVTRYNTAPQMPYRTIELHLSDYDPATETGKRDSYLYHLDANGNVVRRHSSDPRYWNVEYLSAPPPFTSDDEEMARRWRKVEANDMANHDLLATVGLDNCPIKLDELQGLMDYIDSGLTIEEMTPIWIKRRWGPEGP